jgi:hypothetical protein
MEMCVVLIGCVDGAPRVRGGFVGSAVLLIERPGARSTTALDMRRTREQLPEPIEEAHRAEA